jgi:(1->4)-alpha-D-glucan 1-alpha-D-glucosylmutase
VRELTTCLDVYRTYRQPGTAARPEDGVRVLAAADRARAALPDSSDVLDRVVAALCGSLPADSAQWGATGRWQQLTGPVAAKGVEDTALYDSGRMLAAADVGSNPDRPAVGVEEFHEAMVRRAKRWPSALNSTSTHDSKRSHDVRCRLAVLSELASEWEDVVTALDRQMLSSSQSGPPDAADRRCVYETLVGVWPVTESVGAEFVTRIRGHLTKAAREAKRHTNWLEPNLSYEEALGSFAEAVIVGEQPNGRRLIETAVAAVERAGVVNSLASVLLKATAPGVPDTYQGDDRWFFALVDPDNRAVNDVTDVPALRANLPHSPEDARLTDWRSGAVKQFVLHRSLLARRDRSTLFAAGRYVPLEVSGRCRDHVLAFARIHGESWAVAIVPRRVYSLSGADRFPVGSAIWGDTEVVVPPQCPRSLTDAVSAHTLSVQNGRLAVASALSTLPVSLLFG